MTRLQYSSTVRASTNCNAVENEEIIINMFTSELASTTAAAELLLEGTAAPLLPDLPDHPYSEPSALPTLTTESELWQTVAIADSPDLIFQQWETWATVPSAFTTTTDTDSLAPLSALWSEAQAALHDFWASPAHTPAMTLTFGEAGATAAAQDLVQQLIDGRILPTLTVLTGADLGAQGAYAAETDTIFLAKELFGQPQQLLRVVLEELGHFIDDHINQIDAAGDEGNLFAAQVLGDELTAAAIAALKAEDDTATLTFGDQILQVEQADLGPGTFTVGANGQLAVEFLVDSGAYRGQLAIFSLEGMAGLAPNSPGFIQEAARRALSNTPEGYIVISDIDEGASLTGQLGESDRNTGSAPGPKVIAFAPGAHVGVMLVPNGSVQAVFDNPTAEGALRPLFSLAAANPAGRVHLGQIRPGVFAMEDVRFDTGSDADFNDVIFRLEGATGQIEAITNLIGAQQIWLNTPLGQQLFLVADDAGNPAGDPTSQPVFMASDNPIFPPVNATNLQVSIPNAGVPKFNAGNSEAEIAATGAARITFGTQTVYIGTNQVASNNQNPIVASFDSANPANNWIRTDYEVTGADGRGLGLAWDGNSLYAVFTVDGTQGSPSEDFRRAANDAQQAWLRSYGAGGGAKVSVLGRIDSTNGELLDAAYLSAVLNNGNSNTLTVTNLTANTGGNLIISAQSFFSPRRPDGSALTPPTPSGSSPFAYTVEITPDLKRVVSTASPGWT